MRLAVTLLVPVPTPVANPAALIVATVVVAGNPRYLAGDVRGGRVAVGAGCGELLRRAFSDRRTYRRDGDGLKSGAGDGQYIGG